jgi:hypothetical protein
MKYKLQVIDKVGNSKNFNSGNFNVDTKAPTATISYSTGWTNADYIVNFNLNDNDS